MHELMDTFRNAGGARPSVGKDFKQILDRNCVFSIKLRQSQREREHGLAKLKHLLDEHGTCGIICESNAMVHVLRAPMQQRTKY